METRAELVYSKSYKVKGASCVVVPMVYASVVIVYLKLTGNFIDIEWSISYYIYIYIYR